MNIADVVNFQGLKDHAVPDEMQAFVQDLVYRLEAYKQNLVAQLRNVSTEGATLPINADDIVDGAVNAIVTLVQETVWGTHVAGNGADHADVAANTAASHIQGTDTTLGNMIAAINMNTHLINNVVDPVVAQDAATRNYVDTLSTNHPHQDVQTTADPTFEGVHISDKKITVTIFTAAGVQAALNALGGAGEIYCPEGTYNFTDAQIVIPAAGITITGAGYGTLFDASGGQNVNALIDTNDLDYVTIQGIRFLGNGGGGDTGNFIGDGDDSDWMIVRDCYFVLGDQHGIYTSGLSVLIQGNQFYLEMDDVGIYIRGINSRVIGNYVNGKKVALHVENANNVLITNNRIIQGDTDGGLLLTNAEQCSITNNICTHGSKNVVLTSTSHYNTITGNFVGLNGSGLSVAGTYNVVSGNTFFNADNYGVKSTGNYNVIVANSFQSYQERGIWLDNSDYTIVQGNSTAGHSVTGIQEDADCTENLISGNHCRDATPYILNGSSYKDWVTQSDVGIGVTVATLPLDVKAKSGNSVIGGFCIKLTNKTGGNTIAGQLVIASTGTADAFATAGVSSDGIIGIILEAGVADGSEAWIVVSGIADVLIDAGGSTIGDRMIASATAGSADVWNVGGAVATHFLEIGHCIETRAGAGLARCVLHFN